MSIPSFLILASININSIIHDKVDRIPYLIQFTTVLATKLDHIYLVQGKY